MSSISNILNIFNNTEDNLNIFYKIFLSINYIHDNILNDGRTKPLEYITSNSIDFNKVYQLTFNDFYNIIIEILSIRDVEDVTDEMIETYINDPLHIKDGIDPLDPVPTVLFDYEEIRDQIGLVEDDDELDNITEVLNEFSRILPADTRMYDVYNYILTLLNNYV